MENTREKLLDILGMIRPGAQFDGCPDLIKAGLLDSLLTMMLTVEIESRFGVKVSPLDVVPENFKTVDTICALIERLQNK